MSNFSFLVQEFERLKNNSVKSEMYAVEDPDISAICSRKAMETSIKMVYQIDHDLDGKFAKKNALAELVNNRTFLKIIPYEMVDEIHFVRKLGNHAVHSNQPISSKNAIYANLCLYKFQRWMVEVYSSYEVEGAYDATKLLLKGKKQSREEIEEQSQELDALAEENKALQQQLEILKKAEQPSRVKKQKHAVRVEGLNEAQTRKLLIDLELEEAGYNIGAFKNGVDVEYKITFEDGTTGYADYVIWDENTKPLAVIEAKKASESLTVGKFQVKRYAKALEQEFGVDVLLFITNGKSIEYCDGDAPFREIHSLFPKEELVRILGKKRAMKKIRPSTLEIDPAISDRGYQKRVIKSVLNLYESQQRRALLVMATGTGKTRVSASISDVLIRAGWVRRVLFLADRKALVKQACKNFSDYLNETTVNLVDEKKDLSARMHFGTYETVHNFIQKGVYNSAYFDLIVVDEAHRTIYKKYRAIFEYFDSFVLGLTATPADEVHRNTYSFFKTEEGEPTDAYDLETAIENGYLVDFEAHEIDLGIVKRGIKYSELEEDEREEWEDKFDEEEEEIASSEINQRVLNKQTNEIVLKKLHEYGLKVEEGNRLGKTIIFAKNKKHAEFIKEIFDLLYPHRADEAEIIHSGVVGTEDLLESFKNPNLNPQIAISIDMLDTGIDIPELLNLVFFKPLKSKIKFWQMIGRGTRLSPNLFGMGKDKEKFKIFDFCANFSYFEVHTQGEPSSKSVSLKERLFLKRVKLLDKIPKGKSRDAMKLKVQSQLYTLDANAYELKKHRHLITSLHHVDLDYLSEELKENLKLIAPYIEDPTEMEVQRYEMLILNTQEALVKKSDVESLKEEIVERCRRLKSKASQVNAIKEEEGVIDKVLEGHLDLDNIDVLESLKDSLGSLANLSLSQKTKLIKSDFRDHVEEERTFYGSSFVSRATVETEVQKVLKAYIANLSTLKEVKEKELIRDEDIYALKHEVFEYEKMLEDRLKSEDSFGELLKELMHVSKKEIANKVFDNYIEKGDYTQKQIEVSNKIKNILFGKTYVSLDHSLEGVSQELNSEFHPLATLFERLSEDEQEMIFHLMGLLGSVNQALR